MKRTYTEVAYSKGQADSAASKLYTHLIGVVSCCEDIAEYGSEIPGGYKLSDEDKLMVSKAMGALFDLNMSCGGAK